MAIVELLVVLSLTAAQPVEVDHCQLRDYWVLVPGDQRIKVPEELSGDVIRFIQSGWRGKYQVAITIDDGKILDATVVSSDAGGPDDAAKIAVIATMSGYYEAAASNPDRTPVRVVLPAGGIPGDAAKDAACPTP